MGKLETSEVSNLHIRRVYSSTIGNFICKLCDLESANHKLGVWSWALDKYINRDVFVEDKQLETVEVVEASARFEF